MSPFTLYADSRSGNCLKVKWTADYLNIPHDWVETDIMAQQTRTVDFLALNNFGQVPTAVFKTDGDDFVLAQSNAIVLYLAEQAGHSSFLPADARVRAKMYEWLFWEQNSHEPYIAGRRFRRSILGHTDEQIDKEWLPRGYAALERMETTLTQSLFIIGDALTAADVVLLGYTRMAGEGGFELDRFGAVLSWIGRVEETLDIPPHKDKK